MFKLIVIGLSFLSILIIVALYSKSKTKHVSEGGVTGFFLAGRGLSAYFILGSLLLSNLSAEQLVGLNGNAYRFDISGLAWESTAALATVVMALFFLPRYLKRGITTMPQFLEERFDVTTRRMVSIMFLVGYAVMANPTSLYLGAITMDEMFGLHQFFSISYGWSIALLSLAMGAIGGLYAAIGGLKAVAVSDTISGVVLLFASLLVPILGLMAIGHGSVIAGLMSIVKNHPEQLNAIGNASSSVPFSTIFTGMIAANLFYWCTNQMIIQRTLGAKSLAEGQKGVLLAGCVKLLVPLVMVLPGLIAFNMFGHTLKNTDVAYPTLVKAVLPWWLTGVFAAALFGTVVSHFNSVINSSATLFAIDLYQPLTKCTDEKKLVRVGKGASVIFALGSIVIAPMLLNSPSGIFDLLRRFTGFYNIPIISIVLVGFLTRHVPAIAAKLVLIFHIIFYGLYSFGNVKELIPLHYIHIMGLLFVLEVIMMLIIGYFKPQKRYQPKESQPFIPMIKWKYAKPMSVGLVAALISIYVTLSPLGIANPKGIPSTYALILLVIFGVASGIIVYLVRQKNNETEV